VSGVYYFIASTGAGTVNTGVTIDPYVDSTQIDHSYAYRQTGNQMSSVHGVVHVRAGQRVWVRRWDESYCPDGSAFTGFLLSPDL
jgi:hypothetical protein